MRILKLILLALGILLGLVLVLSLLAPKELNAERSVIIHSPRSLVYDQVRHYKNFSAWSPWQELDPNMTTNIEGTDGQVGAKYTWKGNSDVGSGTQEITALKDGEEVAMNLHFAEPFESKAQTYFRLADADGGTRITWGLNSKMPIPFNVMGLFTDMGSAIGKDFEKGLSKLKARCEQLNGGSGSTSQGMQVKENNFAGGNFATIRKTVALKDISAFFMTNYPLIGTEMTRNKVSMAGHPYGFYYSYDEKAQKTDMAAALPMSSEARLGNGVSNVKLPAGKNLCVDYYGDYSKSAPVYAFIEQYAREKNIKTGSPATEEYITDPMIEKDTAKWLTRICFPVAQ